MFAFDCSYDNELLQVYTVNRSGLILLYTFNLLYFIFYGIVQNAS